MIDAVMYGMIPRAKTAALSRLPPVKVFRKPSMVLRTCSMNSMRAAGFTPGVGMMQPTR